MLLVVDLEDVALASSLDTAVTLTTSGLPKLSKGRGWILADP